MADQEPLKLTCGCAKRIKSVLLLLFLSVQLSGYGQKPSPSLPSLTGRWQETGPKPKGYYLPLDLELRADGTAFYYTRHPDTSEGLRYSLRRDTLRLLNDSAPVGQYKLVSYTSTTLTLRQLKTNRTIQLTRHR